MASLSPTKIEKLMMDIKLKYLNQLSDKILFDLVSTNVFRKLGRNELIHHIAKTKDLEDIHSQIVLNPDIYDTEYIYSLYNEALDEMERFGLKPKDLEDKDFGIYDSTIMQLTNGKGIDKMNEKELDELIDDYMNSKINEKEKEEVKQKSQKRLEKMVKEFENEQITEKWVDEYNKDITEKWVKEYDKSILDFFISPSERQIIKQMIHKLIPEQKKYIVDVVLESKAVLKMKPGEQRKYVAEFIRNLAKQSSRPSKF